MYCIVDIETTGYGSKGNKITEISIFKFDGKKIVDEFYSLVDPECSIPYNISLLTGIHNETVLGAPKFYEIAKDVLLFTEGCIFVAHNVSFDYNTIHKEFSEIGGSYKRERLCTVRLSRKIMPGFPSYSLGKLCERVGIEIQGRHRARGDAQATVILFEMLLEKDSNNEIEKALNIKSKETYIPPLMNKEEFEQLPNRTGIYYFLNKKGDIIYVGKALDIKQRVRSHFQDKKKKEVVMQQLVSKVDYKITGSELIALLLESDEIKRLRPMYNSAQKRANEGVGIISYQDGQGYIRLSYSRNGNVSNSICTFYNIGDARAMLDALVNKFQLCPKFCDLQKSKNECFSVQINKCNGACCGKEEAGIYNKRVNKALATITFQDDLILVAEGRDSKEQGLILIEGGIYKGFGYASVKSKSFKALQKKIDYYANNSDVQRIIRGFVDRSGDKIKKVYDN